MSESCCVRRCHGVPQGLLVLLGVLLGVLLVSLALVGPAAAQTNWPPPDVDEALCAQYGLSLEQLQGISEGYPSGYWHPYEPVTRAQAAKFAVLAFNLTPLLPATSTFPDVERDHTLYPYVEAAVAAGMVHGKGDGLFHPDDPITREEAAAIVMRYLVAKHGKDMSLVVDETAIAYHLGLYVDGDQVSTALRPEVALACARAALGGSTQGERWYLNPQAPITRIQAAALSLRHVKPGLSHKPPVEAKQSQQIVAALMSKLLKNAAAAIAKKAASEAGSSLWDALTGKVTFSDIKSELDQANAALANIQDTLVDIQKELAALAAQYQAVSAKIEAMIAGVIAQEAINAIRAAYDDPGIMNNYYYFTHLTAMPLNPDSTKTALDAFLRARLQPNDMPKYLNDIYSAILPTGAKVGVLDEWVVAVCTGALSDQEVWDAYTSLEYYFCQLISYQLKCVHLITEADNYLDATGTESTEFLTGNWFPKLQAECDDFLANITRFCLLNGQYQSTADMMGSQTLKDIMARATFVYCQLLQQIGDQKGAPAEAAYGLKTMLILPNGVNRVQAQQAVAYERVGDSRHATCTTDYPLGTEAGPGVLLWDSTKATLNWTTNYNLRLLSFSDPWIPQSLQNDDTWRLIDYPVAGAEFVYGETVVRSYDQDYNHVPYGTADSVQYALQVVDYSYCSGDPTDTQWWVPVMLGGGGQQAQWKSIKNNTCSFLQNASSPLSGQFQVNWANAQTYTAGTYAYDVRWELPHFTYVGTVPLVTKLVFAGHVDLTQTPDYPGPAGDYLLRNQSIFARAGCMDYSAGGSEQYADVGQSTNRWQTIGASGASFPAITATLQPNHSYSLYTGLYGGITFQSDPERPEYGWHGTGKYGWEGTQALFAGTK